MMTNELTPIISRAIAVPERREFRLTEGQLRDAISAYLRKNGQDGWFKCAISLSTPMEGRGIDRDRDNDTDNYDDNARDYRDGRESGVAVFLTMKGTDHEK